MNAAERVLSVARRDPQSLNPAGLPALPAGAATSNPYRGQDPVAEIGRLAFNHACASCHGVDAEPTPDAPDLRRLNGTCRRLATPELKDRCLADVDQHFLQSVNEGKVRAGLVHMPAWDGVLKTETIWALRTFIESRRPPPPARAPDLTSPGERPSTP